MEPAGDRAQLRGPLLAAYIGRWWSGGGVIVSCDPARIPTDPTDEEVARLMDVIDSRQVLHVGYGAILAEYRSRLYQVWNDNEDELYSVISDHFVKHLEPFAASAQ